MWAYLLEYGADSRVHAGGGGGYWDFQDSPAPGGTRKPCDPVKDTYALVSAKMEAALCETFAKKEEQYEYFFLYQRPGTDLSSHREMEDMMSVLYVYK